MMRLACNCSIKLTTSARTFPGGARMNCCSSFPTISARESWPAQSSKIARPVPSTLIAPSGKSTTGASVVPPQRHPVASRGMLASVNSATDSPFAFVVADLKRTRRRPARLDIGEIERVELRPQNVALIAQRLNHAILLGARGRMLEDILDGKRRVFRGLRQPCFKIIKPAGEPRIMLAQLLHAQRDQVARKKFCQRAGHALDKWPRQHQVQVFIPDKSRRRQNLLRAHHPLPVESGRFRQLDPAQDSALALLVTVMIDNAFSPGAPESGVRRARKNDRVFNRNQRLVVVPVQRPRLQLPAAQFAFVHEHVKGMLVVIALGSNLAQRSAQLLERKLANAFFDYSSTCQLSSATSQPASCTARYSAPASLRMGFVLLACTNILRPTLTFLSARRLSSTGMCPIWCAVSPLPCTRISSSSLQKVPSNSSMFAPSIFASSASSSFATAGRYATRFRVDDCADCDPVSEDPKDVDSKNNAELAWSLANPSLLTYFG